MQKLHLPIVLSVLSFPVLSMDADRQEREIINFAKELANGHHDETYDILASNKQEKDINAEMNNTAKEHEKELKPTQNSSVEPGCTIL